MTVTNIFCESYVQLENTLFLLEQNYQCGRKSTVVVVNHSNLFKLFNYLKDNKYGSLLDIIFLSLQLSGSHDGPLKRIKTSLIQKRYLDLAFHQHFRTMQGSTVYFFCRVFTSTTFYMLRRLVKHNKLIYADGKDYEEQKAIPVSSFNPRYWLNKLKLRLIYGSGITLIRISTGQLAPYIEDKFIESIDQYISYTDRKQWLNGFTLLDVSFVDQAKYSLVFYDVSDYFVKIYLSNEKDYYRTMSDLFEILMKYMSDKEILIKHHPAHQKSMDLSGYGRVISDFVPGEALQREDVLLLGISSVAIYDARAGLSVSLVNLFDFKDRQTKEATKDIIISRATCEVLFPETLDDLERIVRNKANLCGV